MEIRTKSICSIFFFVNLKFIIDMNGMQDNTCGTFPIPVMQFS